MKKAVLLSIFLFGLCLPEISEAARRHCQLYAEGGYMRVNPHSGTWQPDYRYIGSERINGIGSGACNEAAQDLADELAYYHGLKNPGDCKYFRVWGYHYKRGTLNARIGYKYSRTRACR